MSVENNVKPPNPNDFYLTQTFHDPTTSTDIHMLTPMVFVEKGNPMADPSRLEKYLSTVLIRIGPQQIPWRFEIDATSLKEAIEKYPASAQAAATAAIEKFESDIRRAQMLAGVATAGHIPS